MTKIKNKDEELLNYIKTHANREMRKDFVKLLIGIIWFLAHNCSAYNKSDQGIKNHIDKLTIEFNRRLDVIEKKI